MGMHIGISRIGAQQDLTCVAQIGLTRIGVRAQVRNAAGRWVNLRQLVEVPLTELAPAPAPAETEVPEFESRPLRIRKVSALVHLVHLAVLLVASGLRLVSMPFALCLLNIRTSSVAACVLHLLARFDSTIRQHNSTWQRDMGVDTALVRV